MPTSVIYLGPTLAALKGGKPLNLKAYQQHSSPNSPASYSSEQATNATSLLSGRHESFNQVALHDETDQRSHRPKRPRISLHKETTTEVVASNGSASSSHRRSKRNSGRSSFDESNGASQQLGSIQERSDVEADYVSSEGDDSEQTHLIPSPQLQEASPAIHPVSKADRLRMGPARVVGMTRRAHNKTPLLKAIERPIPPLRAENNKMSFVRPGPRPLSEASSRTAGGESIGDGTTVESIPPPPTHAFSLSHLTLISTLISSPSHYLSAYQGGNQHEGAVTFNLLALVIRVGGIEDAPDWKTGGRRRMDRCEIIVKDASECALKVVLERDCATDWAGPRDETSMDYDQLSSIESLAEEASQSSSDVLWGSLDASIWPADTSASRTMIERRRDGMLLPLRPGDVVVLSNLYLVRPRPIKGRSSSRFADAKALSTHAIASPGSGAKMELCWRSSVQRPIDQRRNFDKCLTAFDARCRAIYHLAQSWSGGGSNSRSGLA